MSGKKKKAMSRESQHVPQLLSELSVLIAQLRGALKATGEHETVRAAELLGLQGLEQFLATRPQPPGEIQYLGNGLALNEGLDHGAARLTVDVPETSTLSRIPASASSLCSRFFSEASMPPGFCR